MLINKPESVFRPALWAYIEPDAGIISACLPFLVNVFGHTIVNLLKSISDWGTKGTCSSKKKFAGTTPGTQRATYEAFDLDDDNQDPVPAAMKPGTV